MNKQYFLQFDFQLEKPQANPQMTKKPTRKKVKSSSSDFVLDMMDCLTSPIIVFKSAWMDMVPEDVIRNIPLSRMVALRKGEQMATVIEVLAYLMPRSFEAPMRYEWANIYTWCGLQYALQYNNKRMAEAMKKIAPEKLTRDEQREMDHLRRRIYDKRRKVLKERMKHSPTDTRNLNSKQTTIQRQNDKPCK
ncbi:MAG: hypothetical protein AAFU57_08100 [Bacteroidota bacterium]